MKKKISAILLLFSVVSCLFASNLTGKFAEDLKAYYEKLSVNNLRGKFAEDFLVYYENKVISSITTVESSEINSDKDELDSSLLNENLTENSTQDSIKDSVTNLNISSTDNSNSSPNSLVFKITPYGRQFVSTSLDTNHKSDYGFGFSLGYRRSVLEVSFFKLLAGADIAHKAYTYSKDRTPTHLGNLQFLAKVGCAFTLPQNFGIALNGGLGMEIDFSRLSTNVNFVIQTDLNATYKLTHRYLVLTGIELSGTVPESKDSEYKANALNLNLLLGVQMNF